MRWLLMCAVASALGGRCLRMADYVRGPAATRGAIAAGRLVLPTLVKLLAVFVVDTSEKELTFPLEK